MLLPAGHSLFHACSLSYHHVPAGRGSGSRARAAVHLMYLLISHSLSGSRKTSLTVRAQSTPGRELCPLITHLMSHSEGSGSADVSLPPAPPPPPPHTHSTFAIPLTSCTPSAFGRASLMHSSLKSYFCFRPSRIKI